MLFQSKHWHAICITTVLHSKGDDGTGSFAAQLPTTGERCLTYTYNKKKININVPMNTCVEFLQQKRSVYESS